MTTISRKNTMAALLLAAATVGLPATSMADPANSYRYENCKDADRERQIIGGVVGALAGGVAGREVAGRGDRTEGALIGAAIGAAAGATIADKDCGENRYRRTRSSYPTSRTYGTNRTYGSTNYGYSNYGGTTYRTGSRHYQPRGRAVGNPHVHGHQNHGSRWGFNSRSHTCQSGETRLQHVEWQIDELRRERDYLIDKRRYVGYDRDLERRLVQIGNELEVLKREKRNIKDRGDYRNGNYDYRNRDYRSRDNRYNNNYYYKTKG